MSSSAGSVVGVCTELLPAGRGSWASPRVPRALATDFPCMDEVHGLVYVNQVIDCADRSVVGYCTRPARSRTRSALGSVARASTASSFADGDAGVIVRSDNGLVLPRGVRRLLNPIVSNRASSIRTPLSRTVWPKPIARPSNAGVSGGADSPRWRRFSPVRPWIENYDDDVLVEPRLSSPAAWRERGRRE